MSRITGTWDFKWPQTPAVVRVAFQKLPEDAGVERSMEELIATFEAAAMLWLKREPNIDIEFEKVRLLPAPAAKKGEKWNVRSQFPAGHEVVDYDVLVSFAPLPAFVLDKTGELAEITGQVSVLGSYAKRVGYGVPTTMVGPNLNFRGDRRAYDYYDPAPGKVFWHVILHELGHALGIAHAHQNPLLHPDRRPEFKTSSQIEGTLAKIQSDFWTQFTPDEVHQEIKGVWPVERKQGQPNGISYSTWRPILLQDTERLENKSVMAHPVWSDLLKTTTRFDQPKMFLEAPGDWDLDMIDAMYPRLPAGQAAE